MDEFLEKVFTKVYNTHEWGDGVNRPKSGDGSSIDYTANLRKHLPIIFNQFNINTVLDAPCGDMTWMPLVLKDYPINYIGADIVSDMIEEHKMKYVGSNVKFVHLDITTDPLPQADLLICRDCLFHLTNAKILDFFNNFLKSNIQYILTTTHLPISLNHGRPWFFNTELPGDVESGAYRLLNLYASPYNFTRDVLYRLDDTYGPHPTREMCVWSRDQILNGLKTEFNWEIV